MADLALLNKAGMLLTEGERTWCSKTAQRLRRIAKAVDRRDTGEDDLMTEVLELADSLDTLAAPIVVRHS